MMPYNHASRHNSSLDFPKMQILTLTDEPQHIPTLAQWHHQEWSYLNPGNSIENRIEKMQRYLSPDFIPSTFIAKDHAVLLGSAAITNQDMDTRPELQPWLASVFVAPQYRKQGIGSQLATHLMQQAQAKGIETLYLFTPDQARFYKRLGWEVFTKEFYRGTCVTIMRVKLRSQACTSIAKSAE